MTHNEVDPLILLGAILFVIGAAAITMEILDALYSLFGMVGVGLGLMGMGAGIAYGAVKW